MEKSIENIWAKGFLDSNELKAPKINDLYNRKSTLVIEKIKKTYTLDMRLGIILIAIFAIGLCVFSFYSLALYLLIVFTMLIIYNKAIIKSLEAIKITSNSYDYLLIYRKKFKESIKKSTFLMVIIFPFAILFGYFLTFKNTELYSKSMESFSTIKVIIFCAILYFIFSIICYFIYKLSVKLMYGNSIKKIDEIIADMEELNNEKP